MVRSKWKLTFVDKPLFKFYAKEEKNKLNIISREGLYVENRSAVITDLAIDKKFFVPNGRRYERVIINEAQVGMKFGSLCLTKQIGENMHLYNKVQKKQKEKKKNLKHKKVNRNKIGKKARLKMKSQRLKLRRAKIKAQKKKEI